MMDLEKLIPLLECPITKRPLALNGEKLISEGEICSYKIVSGVPLLVNNSNFVENKKEDHVSNQLSEKAMEFIESFDGLVLNLSAGGSISKSNNVIELEFSIFRNTDVVGDAHHLPFRDMVFDACVCMNAFEHYKNPSKVFSEVHRVLKPGGELFLHTAGLQPLHEAPNHFYNVTRYGLEEWLKDFQSIQIEVSDNFNPVYSLSWMASEIEKGIDEKDPEGQSLFNQITLGEMVEFWRNPNLRNGKVWDIFKHADNHTKEICAAGWQARAKKN